ncbi:transposase family protein [Rufibacter sp. XAAS-G3-1]|uniref:transposase family protein n=1 Tax=Rufibacter sp. XAAS-G3-1 TaxID=2729134 RepID=UPI0015E68228|nr:transposase family protein [Rufibacter sp. XAAS-G3-1]
MPLRYSDISSEEKAIRSHTGLRGVEFKALAGKFEQEWEQYMRCFTWEGKPRERQGKGRRNSVLGSIEDKLLFLLYYLKLNPLQEVLATAFGMGQPQASRWPEVLRARLIATLAKEKVLPERKAERLYRLLEDEGRVLIDATERGVGRSIDDETQKEYYSGKKKPYHQKCGTGWQQ